MPNADQSQPDEDGEFDPWSLADEQREQEAAALRERNFRLELQSKLGKEADEDVVYSAVASLQRNGAEVTPEALAKEYNRLSTKFTRTGASDPTRQMGIAAGSMPPGRRAPQPPKPETFVQTIKKEQKRRGLYAY